MRIGLTIQATDQTINPVELAKEAEARNFYSLYLPEHTHIPTSRLTPAPTGDEELGKEYSRSLDPYIALAAAAQNTKKLRLGTGVSLIAQHHPITLAKCIASLDLLSSGRFILGAGYGWNREEMANHNIKYEDRRELVGECLQAMYALWEQEEAEFKGKHIAFESSWAWPKPQKRPLILIGGDSGPKLFNQIAELANGWIPIGGAGIKESLVLLQTALQEKGRDLSEMEIVPFGVMPTPEKLEYYREIGATEAILRLPAADTKTVLETLDNFTQFL